MTTRSTSSACTWSAASSAACSSASSPPTRSTRPPPTACSTAAARPCSASRRWPRSACSPYSFTVAFILGWVIDQDHRLPDQPRRRGRGRRRQRALRDRVRVRHPVQRRRHPVRSADRSPRQARGHERGGSGMKLVTAVIKPFKLDEVRAALQAFGVHGMTVSRVLRLRPAARPHRGLPRRGVHGRSAAEGPPGDPGRRRGRRRRRRRDRPGRPHRQDRRRQGLGHVRSRSVVRVRTGERGPDAAVGR